MGKHTIKQRNDYIIVIPTFNRVSTFSKKTYTRIIQPYKLEKRVILLIQTNEDALCYKQHFPELKQLRTPKGLLATVNYVADYFPINKKIVMMHDDLNRILYVEPPSAKRITVKDANAFFNHMFTTMKKNKCNLGGVYPTDYPLTMVTQPTFTTDLRFIHDPLTFIINQRVKLDTKFTDHKMDFQRTIEFYKKDKKVLRMNHYTFSTPYNPKSNEGGFGYRTPEKEKEVVKLFLEKYKPYIKTISIHKDGSTSLILQKNPNSSG